MTNDVSSLELEKRGPTTIQLEPLRLFGQDKQDRISSKGTYTVSSAIGLPTKPNTTSHGSSWNLFGIPPVDTSAKTAYQANLNQTRTFPF